MYGERGLDLRGLTEERGLERTEYCYERDSYSVEREMNEHLAMMERRGGTGSERRKGGKCEVGNWGDKMPRFGTLLGCDDPVRVLIEERVR